MPSLVFHGLEVVPLDELAGPGELLRGDDLVVEVEFVERTNQSIPI